jgi:hypothetical protein
MNSVQRKDWSTPTVRVYGNVEKITEGCDKAFGGSDGFTFGGIPIQCAS